MKTRKRATATGWIAEARKMGLLVPMLTGLAIQGCSVGPDYTPPQVVVPDAWHQELTAGLEEGSAPLRTWWTLLDDPVLDDLIARARDGNLDLQTAAARVWEARALVGVARGQKMPSIDGGGAFSREYTAHNLLPDPLGGVSNNSNVGVSASWEIDLFGGIRRGVEAATAGMQAAEEIYRDVLVVLYGEVASNYVGVRTLQERIRLAKQNIDLQRATLQLTKDRLKAQLVPELDVRQAEMNVANTESVVPALEIQLQQTIHRIGVLLGEEPSALCDELLKEGKIPEVPKSAVVGVPADLLRQRPDIRAAERFLAAQTARIGVATADLYPRFFLSGNVNLAAVNSASGGVWGFGPSFQWNLFSGGRVRSAIRVEDARTEQALLQYEQTILLAAEEVENGLVAFVREKDREAALGRSVTAARQSAKLVEDLYRTGLADFQNVLDSQRFLAQQEDQLAGSEGAVTTNLIQIYKAMGGGWQPEPEAAQGAGPDGADEGAPDGSGDANEAPAERDSPAG